MRSCRPSYEDTGSGLRDGNGWSRDPPLQRLLIGLGVLIAIAGLLWPWLAKLPFGRLPGDVLVDKSGFKVFAPFTSMLVLSIVLSLIVWIFRR